MIMLVQVNMTMVNVLGLRQNLSESVKSELREFRKPWDLEHTLPKEQTG